MDIDSQHRIEYNEIRANLIILFIVAVSIVVGVALFLNARLDRFIAMNADLGKVINVAGRQRMLSQNISKTGLLIYYSDSLSIDRKKTIDSLSLIFAEAHRSLTGDNFAFHENKEQSTRLDSLFDELEISFQGLTSTAKSIAHSSPPSKQNAERLLAYESAFLPLMDEITNEYERLSSEVLDEIGSSTTLVNYSIAISVLLSATTVLLVTLNAIKHYSVRLEEAREDLQESVKLEKLKAEKLEFLTNSIKVGIWEKSIHENTESWSDALYTLLGYKKGEISGTAESFIGLVHPADVPILMDSTDSSIKTGLPSTIEVRVKMKSGDYKWVEATGNTQRSENGKISLLIAGIVDIHDRKVLEMQLKAFIERAPASIAMFNKELRYIAASQKWVEEYNIQDQVIIGKSHYDIFPEVSDSWKDIHRKCLNGAVEMRDEDPFERADGTIQWLKWEVRPWYIDQDTVGGILMFTEDVTNNRLKKEELQKAKEVAEEASKAKEQFLATMSHEIRTPLNAINGITQILLLENPRFDQKEHLNLLKFSGESLLSLINDILDISKIEAGKLVLDYAPFDFFYLVNAIKSSLVFRAKENLVTVEVDYDKNLPHAFIGDDTRVTQVLYNLAGNAIKFTENGNVTISAKLVSRRDNFCKMRVSITDTGIGMSEEQQKGIFEAFSQAEGGTTRKYGGTGLGLYITRKILEMMGSEIQLQSKPGEGSTFFFDIELEETTLEVELTRKSVQKSKDFNGKDIHLLVAEDNTANQIIMKKFLKYVDVTFDIAANGLEAFDALQKKTYDLVLMDLQMPVMDGFTATIKIRGSADEYFQNIPIVALTADAFSNIREKTFAVGMTDYLSKPFKPADLYAIIEKYAGRVKKEMTMADSSLKSKIYELGEGDKEFIMEFSNNSMQNYTEFVSDLKKSIKERDLDLLHTIAHKIKSLNMLFELETLESKIDELKSHKASFFSETSLVEVILKEAGAVIEEIKNTILND